MSDHERNERLAAVEAKLDIFLQLLNEIREDLKGHPSREEVDEMKKDISLLKDSEKNIMVKVSTLSAVLTIIVSIIIRYGIN